MSKGFRIELFDGKNTSVLDQTDLVWSPNKFYWGLASGSNILLTSQGYKSKSSRTRIARKVATLFNLKIVERVDH